MIGAYRGTQHFAYPGWRITVPGGPAGGHYKGFTHTQAAGTDLLPQDQYEQDREDGMSSHDAVHASLRNPRGVYRSSGEVPPRPNASGAAMTYRGFQTKRHAGTSVAPGSFPADYFDTGEDQFIPDAGSVHGLGDLVDLDLGLLPVMVDRYPVVHAPILPVVHTPFPPLQPIGPIMAYPPRNGATSVVNQPQPTLYPLPPAQQVGAPSMPPVSPTPAPIVATNEVVPLQDGSGNFVNVSTGAIVPASSVTQNPATGQLTTTMSAISNWFMESTLIPGLPNWGIAAGVAGLALLFMGGKGHR
jgi:hypothetical protein